MNNHNIYSDRKYMLIVKDILDNDEFEKMSGIIHHGLDRKMRYIIWL